MAGLFDIQRPPRGLLDLFGMKGSGATPVQLDPSVSLGVDAAYLYLQDSRRLVSAVAASASPGGFTWNVGSQVPAGEIWIVQNVTLVSTTADITGAGRFRLGYTHPTATSPATDYQLFEPELVITAGTIGSYTMGVQLDPWACILLPGMALGLYTGPAGFAATFTSHVIRRDVFRLLI